jgi:hypothetical protein
MYGGATGATLRGSSDVRIGVATFSVFTDEASGEHTISLVQSDPVIEIADQILEFADPSFVSIGDGIVTFHCTNGDVTYGLREHDDLRETWLGVRSGVAEEDLVE